MLFVWLAVLVVSRPERRFPFVPVVLETETRQKIIRDYFDLAHLPLTSPSTDRIRTCVRGLKAGNHVVEQMNELQILATAGNPDACFIVGTIFEYGLFGQDMNDTKAREYYEIGSKRGHPESQASLAFFMRFGFGGPEDIPQSVVLTAAAAKKSIRALLHSSFAHHFGYHVEKSCHTGYKELEMLSDIVSDNTSLWRKMRNPGVARLSDYGLPTGKMTDTESYIELQEMNAKSGGPMAKLDAALFFLRQAPPMYDRAVPLLKEIMKEVPEAATTYALLLLNHEISSGAENQELEGYNILNGALARSKTAATAVGKMLLLNPELETRLKGKHLLERACRAGSTDACYEIALRLFKGEAPFEKNISDALQMIRAVAQTTHFNVIKTTAWMMRHGYLQGSCDDALRRMLLYLELSFLFDDSRHAWSAINGGDLSYALRIYQHLADMGSEAAAWNAERLSQYMGINSTQWFDLQVVMKFERALYRLAKQLDSTNDSDTIDSLLQVAMRKDPGAKYDWAWRKRWSNLDDTFRYFRAIERMKRGGALPTALAKVGMFLESIPDAIMNRHTIKTRYFWGCLKRNVNILLLVLFSFCLYKLIGLRLKVCL